MDLVYICRPGDNEELRYSIRSAVKNLPHDNLWVVGDKPDWYSGNFIKVDRQGSHATIVRNNLKAIQMSEDISDMFILMNDDFFIIDKVDNLNIFNGGKLKDKINNYKALVPGSAYVELLENTFSALRRRGIEDPIDYELHIPMPFSKSGLQQALKAGMLHRSMYGNMFSIGGEYTEDVKVYDSGPLMARSFDYVNKYTAFLSTIDQSFERVLEDILFDMFPEPSQYEY